MTNVHTCLSIFRHYDLLHSEPFSSDACSDRCEVMDFIFLSSCMLLTFVLFFLILFLSFPETNLGSAEAEKALSKTKVYSSQPVHMKL